MDEYTDLQDDRIPVQQYPHYGYKPVRRNSFMILSLCMGILCFTSCSIIFISMIAGGLSILFAILSKGNDRKMHTMPRTGIFISIFGIFCSLCITISTCYMVLYDDNYRAQLNEACEQIYGVSFDEMIEDMYPGAFDTSAPVNEDIK